jgi:hypothetical protein
VRRVNAVAVGANALRAAAPTRMTTNPYPSKDAEPVVSRAFVSPQDFLLLPLSGS